MKIKATVNANLAREAMFFVSKDATRYYLGGFSIEKHPAGGIILITTDGHRLSVLHDPSGTVEFSDKERTNAIFHIPSKARSLVGAPPKARKPGDEVAMLTFSVVAGKKTTKSTMDMQDGGAVISVPGVWVDGTFPVWRRVIPRFEDELSSALIGLASDYIGDFGAFSPLGHKGIRIIAGDERGGMLIRVDGRDDMFGILMPLHWGSYASNEFPEFADGILTPTPESVE